MIAEVERLRSEVLRDAVNTTLTEQDARALVDAIRAARAFLALPVPPNDEALP